MFQWFRDWRANRRARGRKIFRYWDGRGWVFIDPFTVLVRLGNDADLPKQMEIAATGVEGPDKITSTMLDRLAVALQLYRFNPVTAEGLTDGEILGTGKYFLDWVKAQKKSTPSGPTWQQPMDSESSIGPMDPGGATKSCSDLPNTQTESKPDTPTESCTAPSSP